MGIADLFSTRKKKEEAAQKPLQTDDLHDGFRVQVSHIFMENIGGWKNVSPYSSVPMHCYPANVIWMNIQTTLLKEHGLFVLVEGLQRQGVDMQVINYLMQADTDKCIDVMELCLRKIENMHLDPYYCNRIDSNLVVEEFNGRCLQNGIGLQYINGRIVAITSGYSYKEIIEPAISLLHSKGMRGAEEEFMSAHEKFKNADYSASLVDCGKAFESTLKVICDSNRWTYDKDKDTASALIKIVLDNKILPKYLESQVGVFNSLLSSGVPTIRNRIGAHGAGQVPHNVSKEMAEYMIHLTAVNILFLSKAGMKK